ncbi:MAG TPA: alpha/beta fold hydrolase [Allosphingosinicella sp.]|nr:alpha/beta fold hydrolase [Allosphingosinicella sp.]
MNKLLLVLLLLVATPAMAQQEGFITVDGGVRLFYRIEGSGPQTLVVVHGGPGFSLESIRADFEPFTRNRRVIYYDQRGNGRSTLIDDPEKLAWQRHVADLEALRRHFGLQKMTLLGNSWGGLLISLYAAAHPDRIERLVLDSPAAPIAAQHRLQMTRMTQRARERFSQEERDLVQDNADWLTARDPIAACGLFARYILKLYMYDPAQPVRIRGNLCAGPPEVVRRSLWANRVIVQSLGEFDVRPSVRRVTAPVFIIHGAGDVVPPEGARDWAMAYPDARLLMLPRAGHLIQVEDPAIFFSAIETFLAGRWPEGAVAVAPAPARP